MALGVLLAIGATVDRIEAVQAAELEDHLVGLANRHVDDFEGQNFFVGHGHAFKRSRTRRAASLACWALTISSFAAVRMNVARGVDHHFTMHSITSMSSAVSYVPIMIGADMVKGMIQGAGSEPSWKEGWGPEDYLWSGVQRGGLLGTGQFVADMAGDVQQGGMGVGALAGPTVEQLMGAVRVLGGDAQFSNFALKSMPANALYSGLVGGESVDPAVPE